MAATSHITAVIAIEDLFIASLSSQRSRLTCVLAQTAVRKIEALGCEFRQLEEKRFEVKFKLQVDCPKQPENQAEILLEVPIVLILQFESTVTISS